MGGMLTDISGSTCLISAAIVTVAHKSFPSRNARTSESASGGRIQDFFQEKQAVIGTMGGLHSRHLTAGGGREPTRQEKELVEDFHDFLPFESHPPPRQAN